MAIYAIEISKLQVNGNLVMLQPGSSQLFSLNDFIMKYEVDQSSMNSGRCRCGPLYQNKCTAIKMIKLDCIFFEDKFFKSKKVKGDGPCLYRTVASHIISFCLNNVWTDRFPPGKKPGIKPAAFEVVNDLKEFMSQKDNTYMQIKMSLILSKKR